MGDYTEHLISMAGGDGDKSGGTGIAEVLAAHTYDREKAVCSCSDFVQVGLRCDAQTHPEHVAEVLTAAGFGKLS